MGKCIYSHDDGAYCDKHDHGAVTVGCCGEDKCPDRKALTNYDCLISKTPEEMAEWLRDFGDCDGLNRRCKGFGKCKECWIDWLRQEAVSDG